MSPFASVAIGVSVIAMLSWGIGDFLIQKSSRRLGDWETLFVVTFFVTVILLPFVYRSLPALVANARDMEILVASAIFLTAAAIFEIESFKRGKISAVETMVPFEIPAASILAFAVLGDRVTPLQLCLIITLVVGLFLVSFRGRVFSMKHLVEKGIYLGLIGATFMGIADFLLGWGSRVTDPLVATFIQNGTMAFISFLVLFGTGRLGKTARDVMRNRALVLATCLTDNIGWIGYAFAMTLIPIAVATGLSETSCIIAVLLGIFINKERLQAHQKAGVAIAILSAVFLAAVTA